GGENRKLRTGFNFAPGAFAATVNIVFPTTGTVRVEVKDGSGAPISAALVNLQSSAGTGASVFTDADGTKTIGSVGLGDIYVTASSNGFISTASGKLDSHSTTLVIPVTLSGSRVSLSGHVTAEGGGPSAKTRIIVDVTATS